MQTKIFKNLTDDICFKHLFKEERFLSDFLNSFFDYIGVKKRVVGLKVTTEMEMHGTKRNKKIFYGDLMVYLDTDEIVSLEMYKLCEASHNLYYEKKKIMRSYDLNSLFYGIFLKFYFS